MRSWPDERQERAAALAAAGWNVARLPGGRVTHDLTTDAGLAHDASQGPEARPLADAPPRDAAALATELVQAFGDRPWLLTGSGRAAEAVVATALVHPGQRVLTDEVYVSGRWWIEQRGGAVAALPEAATTHPRPSPAPGAPPVAAVWVTTPRACLGAEVGRTTNLATMHRLRGWVDHACPDVPLVLDASRLWESAARTGDDPRAVAALADVVLLSAGKDVGWTRGGIVISTDRWWSRIVAAAADVDPGAGGLDDADREGIAAGLAIAARSDVVARRHAEVVALADRLRAGGLPVLATTAGSLFLDARAWLPAVPPDQLPAQTLLAALFLSGGVRALGTSTDEPPAPALVRIAVRRSGPVLADLLPRMAEEVAGRRTGLRPLPRDRAAPYLQPMTPVDPASWPAPSPPARSPSGDSASTEATPWLVGRARTAGAVIRALAAAGADLAPASDAVVDLGDLGDPGIAASDRMGRRVPPRAEAVWGMLAGHAFVAVRRDSPLADPLDAAALVALGSWLTPSPGPLPSDLLGGAAP